MGDFAAHVREVNGNIGIQTVQEHCRGVAERGASYVTGIQTQNLAGLQGVIHDMGKLCVDFNDYILGKNNMRRGEIDHCYAGAKYLMQLAKRTKNKQLVETARFVSRTVVSHHGLHDWLEENGENYFDKRISNDERYSEIEDNIHQMIPDGELLEILRAAGDEYQGIKREIMELSDRSRVKLAFYMGQFERLMQSVLVDADRTDTADFQSGKETEQFYTKDIWSAFCENIEAASDRFRQRGDTISRFRCSISDRCKAFADHEVGICRLVVPTGGGKTLSSFRFAINYCKKHGKERIFYIAPYMSILEQNSDVLKSVVGEEYVLEHHSNILSVIDKKEELAEQELRQDKWDVPVIATTLVQFLNTFFSGNMASVRRMHRLCNSVIIIDEVQSIPVKCVSLFNLAMNFISKMGKACVVLCSATQPALEYTEYPLKLDEPESMTGDYSDDFKNFKRNNMISAVRKAGYTFEEAADFCIEKYRTEGNVLFVVNTKAAALHIYELLRKHSSGDTEIIHISTSMCPEHRREIIRSLKESLMNQQKLICVTTQLIEAGVDISFPCVIRSLAGMDNAAQAAGRCNRSGEFGRCCNVYLVNLNEERLGKNLQEIETAKNISMQMIKNGHYSDFLSLKIMEDYFRKYYMERKKELNYNIQDMGNKTDLLDLLSLDKFRWEQKGDRKPFSTQAQAFRTAGKEFQVIDDAAISVIVPHNEEAKQLIEQLRSDTRKDEFVWLLRKSQKYAVGLYSHIVKKLDEQSALEHLDNGVCILQEAYYDQRTGIVLEGKPMDLLIF